MPEFGVSSVGSWKQSKTPDSKTKYSPLWGAFEVSNVEAWDFPKSKNKNEKRIRETENELKALEIPRAITFHVP